MDQYFESPDFRHYTSAAGANTFPRGSPTCQYRIGIRVYFHRPA
jgi:hypothetical protein